MASHDDRIPIVPWEESHRRPPAHCYRIVTQDHIARYADRAWLIRIVHKSEHLMPPLSTYPIAKTSDIDEAQAVLGRELTELRVLKVREPKKFHLEMNGVHLGRTMIGYNRFDADSVVDPGHMDDAVALVLGIGPAPIVHLDGLPVVTTKRGAITSPSRRMLIDRPAGSGALIVRADLGSIEDRLREALGRQPSRPIVFEPLVDLATGIGAQTRRLLMSLIEMVDCDGSVLENPLLRAGFDELLMSALLALPNNYSEELQAPSRRSVAPGVVRRAEEYMVAHAAGPITVSKLVTLCGCSRRTLYSAFERSRGYTPMQFLAETRLRSAQEALQDPSPGDTVTSIAFARGFTHSGRFAAAYRRRFGESPSETLRQA